MRDVSRVSGSVLRNSSIKCNKHKIQFISRERIGYHIYRLAVHVRMNSKEHIGFRVDSEENLTKIRNRKWKNEGKTSTITSIGLLDSHFQVYGAWHEARTQSVCTHAERAYRLLLLLLLF